MTDQKNRKSFIVAGLGFGDEGKGTMTDYLARKHNAHTVVRYNGGSQAAHAVVLRDGREHIFSQFGSGMFIPNVDTYLSQHMLVNPRNMIVEEQHLREIGVEGAFLRTYVHENALVITPFHVWANQLRELARGDSRHGSCGKGIGEAMEDSFKHSSSALRIGDLRNSAVVHKKLTMLRERKLAELEESIRSVRKDHGESFQIAQIENPQTISKVLSDYDNFVRNGPEIVDDSYFAQRAVLDGSMIFEGAQGVLLDQSFGFHPYNTWTDTTFNNALSLLKDAKYDGETERIGVLRSYSTRHGAGPFVAYDEGMTKSTPEKHNATNDWQSNFRIGPFDYWMAKYALDVVGDIDAFAMTHLDCLQFLPEHRICVGYNMRGAFKRNRTLSHFAGFDGLTNMLATATPIFKDYREHTRGKEDGLSYAQAIARNLNVNLRYTSSGPTAEDKQALE